MTTQLKVANRAIALCGVGEQIEDLEEDATPEAEAVEEVYDDCLHELYREFKWPHATKIVTATLVSDEDDDYSDEWGYAYSYPSDCERLHRITNDLVHDTQESLIRFKIIHDSAFERVVLTSQEDAEFEYTFFNDDEATFPWDFAEALAHRIAYKILPRLTEDPDKLKMGAYYYRMSQKMGRANALNENKPARPNESEFTSGR